MRPIDNNLRIERWSKRLGLASTPLHRRPTSVRGRSTEFDHVAMLDGVDGSLAVSSVPIERNIGLDWAWSSQLRAHVDVGLTRVVVHPVGQRGDPLGFELDQVENNIEKFYNFVTGHAARPATTIVEHIANCFRSHRSVVELDNGNPEASLASFLAILDGALNERNVGVSGFVREHRERVLEELSYNNLIGRTADLGLMVRHAGGMVFQEAHADLDADPIAPQLFGLAPSPKRSTRNKLGAYYTPPGLARTLCELAIKPHLENPALTIFDPACGSGIFLIEAVRTLERYNYQGAVKLVGFDISSIAIRMAQFALKNIGTHLEVSYELQPLDFLRLDRNVAADLVLMNPPFVAYENLTAELKATIRDKLGDQYKFKPDFSMLFISLALKQLAQGGTCASLLPAGVLQQNSAADWRSSVVEGKTLDLVAVLGDHGLFRDALVNISALILRDGPIDAALRPTMFWASQKRGAGSEGLRHLRRWADGDKRPPWNPDWSIYQARAKLITSKGNWTPRPNSLGNLPDRLAESYGVSSVGSLFHVEQGIRPGPIGERARISVDDWASLPSKEKPFFRPVAENNSIRAGTIIPDHMIFFPAEPMTSSQVREGLPKFYETRIAELGLKNDELVEATRARRGTNDLRMRRIVSRIYVSQDSFAVDYSGETVAVQANAWLPKPGLVKRTNSLKDLLTDYALLMNSRFFFLLLREFCRIVGGGQVEASQASTMNVPLPDLPMLYGEFPSIAEQAERLRTKNETAYPNVSELNEFAAMLYRTEPKDWGGGSA